MKYVQALSIAADIPPIVPEHGLSIATTLQDLERSTWMTICRRPIPSTGRCESIAQISCAASVTSIHRYNASETNLIDNRTVAGRTTTSARHTPGFVAVKKCDPFC